VAADARIKELGAACTDAIMCAEMMSGGSDDSSSSSSSSSGAAATKECCINTYSKLIHKLLMIPTSSEIRHDG